MRGNFLREFSPQTPLPNLFTRRTNSNISRYNTPIAVISFLAIGFYYVMICEHNLAKHLSVFPHVYWTLNRSPVYVAPFGNDVFLLVDTGFRRVEVSSRTEHQPWLTQVQRRMGCTVTVSAIYGDGVEKSGDSGIFICTAGNLTVF